MTPPRYSNWLQRPAGSWQPTSITGPNSGTGSASRETTASPPPRPAATFERHPQLAGPSTAQDKPADWLRAGQALQRVLLTATTNGVATSFLYQPIELHDIEQPEYDWWPWPECPQIIIRLGYGPPEAGSPRRE